MPRPEREIDWGRRHAQACRISASAQRDDPAQLCGGVRRAFAKPPSAEGLRRREPTVNGRRGPRGLRRDRQDVAGRPTRVPIPPSLRRAAHAGVSRRDGRDARACHAPSHLVERGAQGCDHRRISSTVSSTDVKHDAGRHLNPPAQQPSRRTARHSNPTAQLPNPTAQLTNPTAQHPNSTAKLDSRAHLLENAAAVRATPASS